MQIFSLQLSPKFCFLQHFFYFYHSGMLLLLLLVFFIFYCNILNLPGIVLFECEWSLEFMNFPLNHGRNSQFFKLIYRCIFQLKGFSKGRGMTANINSNLLLKFWMATMSYYPSSSQHPPPPKKKKKKQSLIYPSSINIIKQNAMYR